MVATDKRRNTKAYWNARLKRMGLEMDRGRPSWLVYGHDVTKLDTDGRKTYNLQPGRMEHMKRETAGSTGKV